MKSTEYQKSYEQLSVEECTDTYGGNYLPDLIFFPVGFSNNLGTRIAPDLVELYLKNSLFLQF